MKQPEACPDWPALVARRDLDVEGERLWDEALEHFDACPRCQKTACDAEPTLVFRRLPAPPVEAAEIDAVRQAVHALRRGRALVATSPAAPERRSRRPFRSRRPLRAGALAAALTAVLGAALLLQGGLGNGALESGALEPAGGSEARNPVAAVTAEPSSNALLAWEEIDLDGLPLVEDVDPALGTLIELHDDEVSIVMVVAETQDALDV